jgi:hypothetical protein
MALPPVHDPVTSQTGHWEGMAVLSHEDFVKIDITQYIKKPSFLKITPTYQKSL